MARRAAMTFPIPQSSDSNGSGTFASRRALATSRNSAAIFVACRAVRPCRLRQFNETDLVFL
jgi:hypothetical protein